MSIEFTRLNHVTICAPSGEHETVRAYYGDILGLKEVKRPAVLDEIYDIIWFDMLDILLHVEFSPNFAPSDVIHFALEVKNIHEVEKYLKGKGVVIREAVPISDRDRFYAVDPFGNFIEIIEMKGK